MARLSRYQHDILVEESQHLHCHAELVHEKAFCAEKNPYLTKRQIKKVLLGHYSLFDGRMKNVIKAMLLGENLDTFRKIKGEKITALHLAVQYEHVGIVNLLIRYGANINLPSRPNLYTPLHYAAKNGNLPLFQRLLRCGANPQAEDNNHQTPLAAWTPKWLKYVYLLVVVSATMLGVWTRNFYLAIVLPTLSLFLSKTLYEKYCHCIPVRPENEMPPIFIPDALPGYEPLPADSPSPIMEAVSIYDSDRSTDYSEIIDDSYWENPRNAAYRV